MYTGTSRSAWRSHCYPETTLLHIGVTVRSDWALWRDRGSSIALCESDDGNTYLMHVDGSSHHLLLVDSTSYSPSTVYHYLLGGTVKTVE